MAEPARLGQNQPQARLSQCQVFYSAAALSLSEGNVCLGALLLSLGGVIANRWIPWQIKGCRNGSRGESGEGHRSRGSHHSTHNSWAPAMCSARSSAPGENGVSGGPGSCQGNADSPVGSLCWAPALQICNSWQYQLTPMHIHATFHASPKPTGKVYIPWARKLNKLYFGGETVPSVNQYCNF